MSVKMHTSVRIPAKPSRWSLYPAVLAIGIFAFSGCQANQPGAATHGARNKRVATENLGDARMWMTVGDRRFAITLADSDAARAFTSQFPLTLEMAELNGNEKHADLSKALSTQASRPGTIQKGDLMLYGSTTVVVFYERFQSSYSYTRLGHVNDATELSQVLGAGDVVVAFSAD